MFGLYLEKANEIELCETRHTKRSTNKFKFLYQQYVQ